MAQTQEFSYPESSISPPDPEMFRRVWDRVMAREEGGTEHMPPSAQPPSAVLPVPLPTPEVSPETGCKGVCLGMEDAARSGMLREMLEEICFMGRFYRAMLRQAQGSAARQLRCMAEEQQRQMKQLGVMYFLLSGEQFVYGNHGMSVPRELRYGLREMFLREQQRYCVYAQAAKAGQESCLGELMEEFAQTAQIHTEMIRHILEGM